MASLPKKILAFVLLVIFVYCTISYFRALDMNSASSRRRLRFRSKHTAQRPGRISTYNTRNSDHAVNSARKVRQENEYQLPNRKLKSVTQRTRRKERRKHEYDRKRNASDSERVTERAERYQIHEAVESLPADVLDFLDQFVINENVSIGVDKPMPSLVQLVNHYWQIVEAGGPEIYLYSAYYDDRPTVGDPLVRIISIAEVNPPMLFCLYWYLDQKNPDTASIKVDPIGPKISPDGETKYEQYIFSCMVYPGKGPPEQVSVVSTNDITPTNLLRVQIPERPKEKIEFGHCMSVIYWKHDPYKIVEWLELHRLFGVGEVTVYNNSLDEVSALVFQHYAKEGFVDFRQAPSVLDDDEELTILMNMSPTINDCLYRNMYRYKWIVCTDVDEMIVPRVNDTYSDLIREIDEQAHRRAHAHSYMFSNVYFFTDLGAVAREPWFLMTQRFLRHVAPSIQGYSVKSITNPLSCAGLQNHVCWQRLPRDENKTDDWNFDVERRLAMNYHYKKCHLDVYEEQFGLCSDMMKKYSLDKTMRRFGPQLYDKVVDKLLTFGMIEEDVEPNDD